MKTAAMRSHSERAEVLAADEDAVGRAKIGSLADAKVVGAPREHPVKRLLLIPELLPDGPCQLRVAAGVEAESAIASDNSNLDQLVRVRDRQRPQRDGIDQLEDGRVRADAKRKRQHSDDREPGVFQQRAERVTEILNMADPFIAETAIRHCGQCNQPYVAIVFANRNQRPVGTLVATSSACSIGDAHEICWWQSGHSPDSCRSWAV